MKTVFLFWINLSFAQTILDTPVNFVNEVEEINNIKFLTKKNIKLLDYILSIFSFHGNFSVPLDYGYRMHLILYD